MRTLLAVIIGMILLTGCGQAIRNAGTHETIPGKTTAPAIDTKRRRAASEIPASSSANKKLPGQRAWIPERVTVRNISSWPGGSTPYR